jgi:prepilin-type N-terminal cleavage/methylation domain-containing protein/prepilin-type processing-associated H-X9-DG protein
MRRKGFTLVELLVVIAIIALLMGILMPALAQVRRLAQRMMCGTNLKGLGSAIYTYLQDNDDDFPRAGGRKSQWAKTIADWEGEDEEAAFGETAENAYATIGSCWYLLVKYADVPAKQFICKGDVGAREFKLSDYDYKEEVIFDITDPWDFANYDEDHTAPGMHYSYSYHHPFHWDGKNFPLNGSSNPASPVAADRNLWFDKNAEGYRDGTDEEEVPQWKGESYYDPDKTGNAAAHQREGQNVLFVDGHASFEKYPNCGIMNDNIYKQWPVALPTRPTNEERQLNDGGDPSDDSKVGTTTIGPESYEDAFLVNELSYE